MPLENLPINLKSLSLTHCYEFNRPLDKLPSNMNSILLNDCSKFNQSLCNLPTSLNNIYISWCAQFNQHLDQLPKETKLHISKCRLFDKTNILPPNTTILTGHINKNANDLIKEYGTSIAIFD
jgi:hypothetical protein